MIIVFNPLTGAPIEKFIHETMGKLDPHPVGESRQYPDDVAEVLLETFGFLERITPEKAAEILKKPGQNEFKCDYPTCEYSSAKKIGLLGHQRGHKGHINKLEPKETVIPDIPVAKGTPVEKRVFSRQDSQDHELVGEDWYGPGLTQE